MVRMLCNRAEIELYLSSLGSSRFARVSRNCNLNLWALGCQPGWACSTLDVDDKPFEESVVPSRAESCRPCCPGFFCPRGLTCMMRKCFFPNKPPQQTKLVLLETNSIIFREALWIQSLLRYCYENFNAKCSKNLLNSFCALS